MEKVIDSNETLVSGKYFESRMNLRLSTAYFLIYNFTKR